jgi:hypothetical protein
MDIQESRMPFSMVVPTKIMSKKGESKMLNRELFHYYVARKIIYSV